MDASQMKAATAGERSDARLFLDTLNDFHGDDMEDGVLFAEAIAEALFGIESSEAGRQKLDAWIAQAKATMETNLVWRLVALNQTEARRELDAVLAEAEQHKDQRTLANALDWIGYTAKSLKAFAETYKKAQTLYDANTKASSPIGTVVFGTRLRSLKTRGIDRFAIGVGDAVFRHFRVAGLADHASEKIIQHIFSIRAFVNPADSANLILAQARNEELVRRETLKRLRTARTFLAADTQQINSAQTEQLRWAWAAFRNDTSSEKAVAESGRALKDARLALVVGLIEGVNFAKLMAECKTKNDMKSWFSLLASGMSISSALFDIATVPAKNLPGMGSESWGFQSLKLWGGLLSGGAAFIGAVFDRADANSANAKGYHELSWLYTAKSALGVVSGTFTLAITFTYSAPLLARLSGKAALGTAVQAVGSRAAAVIGLRILGMALGGWITVSTFGFQFVIWTITPNAIEEWIDHSAFGKHRKTGGYRMAEEQDERLKAALIEMGFQ